MARLVNVHYLDKGTFMKGNADEGEESIVFYSSPTYDEVVVKVRKVLDWIDPNVDVKLIGKYDVGVGGTLDVRVCLSPRNCIGMFKRRKYLNRKTNPLNCLPPMLSLLC